MAEQAASRWERQHRILAPEDIQGQYRLLQSPTAWLLPDGLLRIFYGARNEHNRSQLLSIDVDMDDAMRVVRHAAAPLLRLEDCPDFARDGIGPCDALRVGDELWLYGGSLDLRTKPFTILVTLFTSRDDGASFTPPRKLLSAQHNHGLPVAMPCVRRDGDQWQMWYTSYQGWLENSDDHPDGRYALQRAHSRDGLHWHPDSALCVDLLPGETGLARPTVYSGPGGHEMWYSARGPHDSAAPELRRYRIGYARSPDALRWERMDREHQFINPPQPGDWDSEMQCYPQVLTLPNQRTCMFYCGSGFGATGFGYAFRLD